MLRPATKDEVAVLSIATHSTLDLTPKQLLQIKQLKAQAQFVNGQWMVLDET